MANLPCRFDWIWNQLKFKLLGTPVFLDYLKKEDTPVVSAVPSGEKKTWFFVCLSSLFLVHLPILTRNIPFANSRISFSEIPTQTEVQQFSRNALNLQSQTGCWDIHSYKRKSYWSLSPSSETVTAGPLRPYFVNQYTNLFLIFNQFCSFIEVWQIHFKLLSCKILVLGWYLKEIRAT